MLDRRLFLLGGLSAAALSGHAAEGPRQNLWVELRWTESVVSGAAVAGVRRGAVVVGTAGSVSPKAPLTLSTQRQEEQGGQIQRVLVLNGYAASILLSDTQLLEWLDYGVELRGGARADQTRIQAQSRSAMVERQRGFALTPHWPGGRQPVRVELRTLGAGAQSQQAEVFSTVQVPLDEWRTVARSGAALQRSEPGVISSSDAESRGSRELQLRISVAP
jgi:hypothetical protein